MPFQSIATPSAELEYVSDRDGGFKQSLERCKLLTRWAFEYFDQTSNGSRLQSWKLHLQRLSDQLKLPVTVCHYPPGTSKWNKIEHRLFSFVSMNWKGRPLVSYEAIVNLIESTKTRSGLKVKAVLDTKSYETGHKITNQEMEELRLKPHAFHGDWNYSLGPRHKTKARRA